MLSSIDAPTLKAWLGDEREIALVDVSEHGQYGSGHPFFAVSLPYSRFELSLSALVPNPSVRLVLCDQGDGVAARAVARAAALGYRNLHILAGGKPAWQSAGYTLFAGVNVPSKTFGELVHHERQTPRLSAAAVQAMRDAQENFVIVDGRPFVEFHKMSIPGGICCPNGELALRIKDIAPDPKTTIVVNCAGRTRARSSAPRPSWISASPTRSMRSRTAPRDGSWRGLRSSMARCGVIPIMSTATSRRCGRAPGNSPSPAASQP
jgi:rhodanese-related sulfurtransferase